MTEWLDAINMLLAVRLGFIPFVSYPIFFFKFKSFVNDFTEKLQEKKCLIVVDNKVVSNSVLSVLYHDVQALFDRDTNEIADKMICPVTLFFWSAFIHYLLRDLSFHIGDKLTE